MSEKLASLGRLGAEELTDVLNLLFAALLDDAAAYGGGLLKYGGDAVLLFFEGDDHAARAAAATHRMRATLRRVGTVKTSKGTVRVRMSVGIHTGAFDFFLVGDSHHELIVTGVGATTTCDMETAADAGEILVSPATAAALSAGCVGERKGDGFILRRAPRTPAREPSAWGVVPEVDPLPFIPVGLHRHIGAVGTDAEHRHVAVGFIAFGGVDELLADRGGSHTASVLHDFIAACQAAFDRYEVCFLYADIYGNGGKVFFTSGAPVSHEDNEERVVRAALQINSRPYDGLHLHTGLNRGYVFAGDVGATFRRTYTIIGDAVNTAARVMASCPVDGQVRAMPEVLDLCATVFEQEPQAPFRAKGKALPLTTFAVGAPVGTKRPDAPLPLVGRDQELAALAEHADAAAAGAGGFVLVVGEPGVGKSRLVEALRERSERAGTATLVTFAERYEQTTPYFALRQLVRAILGDADDRHAAIAALAPTQAEWADQLGPVFGETTTRVTDDAYPRLLGRLLVGLLDASVSGTALWVLENVDLLDDGTLQVLETMRDALAARPWLVVGVGRTAPDRLLAIGASVAEIGPLSDEHAIALARAASTTLLPTEARLIAARANGNPLFVRQLVAAAAAGAELTDSVETAVAARIDRLQPRDRDVLRTAAVLGGRFEVAHLRALHGGTAPDLAPLADFVATADDAGVFRQGVYRDVAYASLSYRRRRTLHLAAGRLLEKTGAPAARLSLHFDGAQAWPESWRYSCAAGDDAFRSAAKSVAAALYERAVLAGRRLGDEVDRTELGTVAVRWAEAVYLSGRVAEARAALTTARRLTPRDSLARAMVELREGVIYSDSGNESHAARWFTRGLATLERAAALGVAPDSDWSSAAVSLTAGLANCRLRQGRLAEAMTLSQRATALAETSNNEELRSRAYTLGMLVAITSGDLRGAIEQAEASLAATRRDGRFGGSVAAVMTNLGALQLMAGDWVAAEALVLEAIDRHTALGNDAQATLSQVNAIELFIDQGRWAEAEAMLDVCEPVARVTDDEEVAAFAALFRVRLSVRQGGAAALPAVGEFHTYGFDDLVFSVRVEGALASADAAAARAELGHADAAGVELARRAAYEAAAAALEGGDQPQVPDDDAFNAVLVRSLRGHALDGDADAARLGIVDVPVWAKP